LVVALIVTFAIGNTVTHAINGDIHNVWDGLKYFGEGAVAGTILGIGLSVGLAEPILGTIMKGAGIIYGAATLYSIESGLYRGGWRKLDGTW